MNEQWNKISALAATCSVTLERSVMKISNIRNINFKNMAELLILFPHELAKYIYFWNWRVRMNPMQFCWCLFLPQVLNSLQSLEPTCFFTYLGRMKPIEEETLWRTCHEYVAESGLEPTTVGCNAMFIFPPNSLLIHSAMDHIQKQNKTIVLPSLIDRIHQWFLKDGQ